MTKKLFAVLLLSVAAAACEPNSTETKDVKPSPAAQTSTPAPSPSVEVSTTAPVQWKAGDKVKVTGNGATMEATIVSVDEKLGKAIVKVQGETKERTVNLSDIVK
jgi:hypothetical protein